MKLHFKFTPMKRLTLPLVGLVALVCLVACDELLTTAAAPIPLGTNSCSVYFSPRGGCTEAVIRELNNAKFTVLVQAYSFTSAPIAKALVEAHRRGVKVEVILDKSQRTASYSSADFVAHAGILTLIDAKHSIAHNKIIIVDGQTVITGSFNFSNAAEEHNAENLLILRDSKVAKRYIENWELHEKHSERYEGR